MTARRHTPARVGNPAGRLALTLAAVRDAGGRGATVAEVAAQLDGNPEPRQVAPLVAHLATLGYLIRVGQRGTAAPGQWPDAVYVTARTAHLLGPAAAHARHVHPTPLRPREPSANVTDVAIRRPRNTHGDSA